MLIPQLPTCKLSNQSSTSIVEWEQFTAKTPVSWLAMYSMLVFFVLSACQPIPERDSNALEISLPAQWHENAQQIEPIATSWLASFNDSQLAEMVQEGLANNFELKSSGARVDAVKEQATIAGAGRLPQLYFVPVYWRGKDALSSESGQFLARCSLSIGNWMYGAESRLLNRQQ